MLSVEDEAPPEPDYKKFLREFFQKEPCVYSHEVFQHAAQVFDALKHEPRDENPQLKRHHDEAAKARSLDIPNINFGTENDKRLTFTLVFQSLKYQRFLEDMLADCCFFQQYPEFKEDTGLIMVMLCDFKQRKFQKRIPLPDEQLIPYCAQIEDALWRSKTKLNAALARSRIKARVLSIDHLLPDSVRQNDKIGSNMHIYCWVNYMKTSMREVLADLKADGFSVVQTEAKLIGKTYVLDHQCTDMIAFSYEVREVMEDHQLVRDGHIVLQDKSSCIGAQSVRALINEGDDILQLNIGSGITTVHLASLTHNSDTIIHAFGINNDKQHKQVLYNLERYGVKSRVKLFTDNFMEVDYADERLKHIKVALVTAECTRSGVANPVNFIVSEGEASIKKEDMSILRDLSLGYTDENKLGELVVRHNSLMKHALRFPRVQACVYATRSLMEAENEGVVTRAIEYVNMVQQKKTPFRIAPPVLPLSDRDIELENPLNGKYLRYPPSNFMSGCFVATVTREADDPKEAAKDILARAAARGIITGVPVKNDEKGHKKKGTKKKDKDKSKRKRSPPRSPKRSSKTPTKEPPAGVPVVSKPQTLHAMENGVVKTSSSNISHTVHDSEKFKPLPLPPTVPLLSRTKMANSRIEPKPAWMSKQVASDVEYRRAVNGAPSVIKLALNNNGQKKVSFQDN